MQPLFILNLFREILFYFFKFCIGKPVTFFTFFLYSQIYNIIYQ